MNPNASLIISITLLSKAVDREAHAKTGGTNHCGEGLLGD